MARIKVEVTQDDIDLGKPNDYSECPVALALARATGRDWWVKADVMSSLGGIPVPLVATPAKVSRFIRRFDRKADAKPFRFRLEVPS